jgi:hypothetical protein
VTHPLLQTKNTIRLKSHNQLFEQFTQSIRASIAGTRLRMLETAIKTLGADPLFQTEHLSDVIIDIKNQRDNKSKMKDMFDRLSSGHKIVILTIAGLV